MTYKSVICSKPVSVDGDGGKKLHNASCVTGKIMNVSFPMSALCITKYYAKSFNRIKDSTVLYSKILPLETIHQSTREAQIRGGEF